MKKLISVFLSIILIVLPISAIAVSDAITVKVGGKLFKFPDAKPILESIETPMMPITPIATSLGYKVNMAGKNKVVVKKGNTISYFFVGETKVNINGEEKVFAAKSTIRNGRVYVSSEYISQLLNCTCDWFKESKTVIINDSSKGEVPIYTRLWQSGEYELLDANTKYYLGCDIKPKNNNYGFILFITPNLIEKLELCINIKKYDLVTRTKVKEILKICYPKEFNNVYKNLIGVMREEIYKLDFDIFNRPGLSDIYYDNRYLGIIKQVFNKRYVNISVGIKNYVYEKMPPDLNQAQPRHSMYYLQEIKDNQIYYEK